MKSPKSSYRILLAVLTTTTVICLLAVAAGWFYVFQMSNQVSAYSTEALGMRQQSSKLSSLSISLQKVIKQKSVVYGAIPTTKDESTFMADIETVANANGLAITSSSVGNSQTKAAKTGEFSQTLNKQEYYELPIRYEVMGQYASFTKFISDLGNLRRLNTVNDIAVTADLSDKTSSGKVKATFFVTIYLKK
jgi:Tfp pilus assembly protein PilO